ncbi:MAG: hypothetical protein MPK06_02785 [Alphaproteobacteria bacterium]|nr:hypothetical protein [Alphaproteobacteria bacterium]MDA8003584.1 hypothetical protein [Alphaproteobacteria bacterium]MDA8005452.1 hypothetical protein [Alphaproteobacteria bacterium]MDA8012932.1 hypothetical protein [Alphaproteobacteria bacterium]
MSALKQKDDAPSPVRMAETGMARRFFITTLDNVLKFRYSSQSIRLFHLR